MVCDSGHKGCNMQIESYENYIERIYGNKRKQAKAQAEVKKLTSCDGSVEYYKKYMDLKIKQNKRRNCL